MKKVLSLLIIVLSVVFIPVVNAANFTNFTVRTSFSNDIDVTKIPAIYVLVSVPGEEDYREIELTRDNLFNYSTNDMPNTEIEFDSAYIAGDRTGKYDITGELKRNDNANTATLQINVLEGGTSTTKTTTSTTTATSSQVGDDDVIIVDDNGKVQTTISTDVFTSSTEKQISEGAKARLHLYKYVFLGVGALIAFVVLVILVKIVRTNNLM